MFTLIENYRDDFDVVTFNSEIELAENLIATADDSYKMSVYNWLLTGCPGTLLIKNGPNYDSLRKD